MSEALNIMYQDELVTAKRIETPNGRVRQVAALVYRLKKQVPEVLLITSRGTGRWVLPKGWPQVGKTFVQSAEAEAYEEAGVRGETYPVPVGTYTYEKHDVCEGENGDFTVDVFPLLFERQEKKWPERGERRLDWFSREEAAQRVEEPGLKELLRSFDPNAVVAG
ncbi:NUDIX hydrolase [Phyllobacterium sp. 21LDTY02-6]|jgi:8-oxo-dGTP pyrophosphatase MutT (NUDIX family)|uniref:NUDIX hydrolase n=1 Tax=unclassified Phyllobacterium TaxID=2638441 RepID=UPI002022824C|nr:MULTISPECIES: NUDIX hydrolase [unclassified Phyllobacterium]MCO4316261.1 NUDIX hydrolase [Phyllobacterium sp. 21LDTY02-6]MCX8282576.1 NUDIX hydrolase [Phyllobacterium sp. 0TCS1.6C]MCX8292492.1 NUDIX hydrolase [Phyllobacterium sp. 0TCS1.6A]